VLAAITLSAKLVSRNAAAWPCSLQSPGPNAGPRSAPATSSPATSAWPYQFSDTKITPPATTHSSASLTNCWTPGDRRGPLTQSPILKQVGGTHHCLPSTRESHAKLDAVEDLALLAEDTGITLVHLALAIVMQHPGVTAPIVGPRTMEQLDTQIGAVDVALGTDVLDRIDEIVAPGKNVGGDDAYATDALTDPFLRRRRTA